MTNDSLYALILLAIFVSVVARGWFFSGTLELLLSLTRPGATVLLLGALAFLYSRGFVYTSLAFGLLVVFLLKDVWTNWVRSDARRLYLDLGRDQARFDEKNSIDIQFARGSAIHDSPNMLHKDSDATPLLLYPPSQATLESMSG